MVNTVAMQAATKHAALLKQAGKVGDLQALNEQLLHNQQAFQQRVKSAEQRAELAEAACKDLKEQVKQASLKDFNIVLPIGASLSFATIIERTAWLLNYQLLLAEWAQEYF